MNRILSQKFSASSTLCVTRTAGHPLCFRMPLTSSMSLAERSASIALNGSSSRRARGSESKALARASLCDSPPESRETPLSPSPCSPTSSSASSWPWLLAGERFPETDRCG